METKGYGIEIKPSKILYVVFSEKKTHFHENTDSQMQTSPSEKISNFITMVAIWLLKGMKMQLKGIG